MNNKRNIITFIFVILMIAFFNISLSTIAQAQAQNGTDILEPNPISQEDINRVDGNNDNSVPSPVDFVTDDAGRPVDSNHQPLSSWTIESTDLMSDGDVIRIFNTTGVDLNSQSQAVRDSTIQAFRRSLRESQSQYNNTPANERFSDISTNTAYNRALTQSIQQFIQARNQEQTNNDSSQTSTEQPTENTGSDNIEYLTINARRYTCPQNEGLAGTRFLFFRGPLVPCGINKQCAGTSGVSVNRPCTICHFLVLIQNFFNLLLSMLVVVSIFMLTVAGVLYIISAGGKMTGIAKEIIQKTLLGFGLFLLSWLIIFTLLSLLSANTSMLGRGQNGIFQFTCDETSAFYIEPNDPAHTNLNDPAHTNSSDPAHTNLNDPAHTNTDSSHITPANQTPVSPTVNDPNVSTPINSTQSEDVARANLWEDSGGHITFWESSAGATNIRNLRPSTRQGLLNFQRESGLDIVVTGGAEADPHADGTYSHANGYKVDIDDTPAVNDYITNHYNYIGNRAGDRARVYSDGNGNYYVREGNHWDVYYSTPSPPLSTL